MLSFPLRAQLNAEYFVDIDPGFGQGTPIVLGANPESQLVKLDISTISSGLHRVFIRVKNAAGIWSQTSSRPIIVTGKTTISNLVHAEYFVDVDPGFGQGQTIAIMDEGLPESLSLNVTDLTLGFHQFFIRVQDEGGHWSLTQTASFVLLRNRASRHLQAVEYFFDRDPGFGNGTSMAIGPGAVAEESLLLDVSSLSAGEHRLVIRSHDAFGVWSLTHTESFTICTPPSSPTSEQSTYAICVEDGGSETVTLEVTTDITDPIFRWYDLETLDRTLLTENSSGSFTVTNIDRDTTFYVSVSDAGCESGVTAINIDMSLFPDAPIISHDPINDQILVSNVTGNLQWYLQDQPIDGAMDQRYEPAESGSYQLSITSEEGCESLSDPFEFEIITGINDQSHLVNLYPNPATNILQFTVANNMRIHQVRIIDLVGKEWYLQDGKLTHVARSNSASEYSIHKVDVSHLPSGLYILVMKAQLGVSIKQSWIKQ